MVVVCSAWPLTVPIAWYTREIRHMRMVFSPAPLGPGATNRLISAMTYVAIKFVIALFSLSVVTCVVVGLRRKRGAKTARVTAELMVAALSLCVYLVLSASISAGLDLSRLAPKPLDILPTWSVLAAGLSFLVTMRSGVADDNAA